MPDIGVRTAARILLYVGDASQFPTAGHLAAYAGLAEVTRRSGTSIRGEFPARSGNKRLKRALFLSAFAALRSEPVSRAYYDRKRAQGKKHNAALICLSRRRRDVLFAMLRNQEPYRVPAPAPILSRLDEEHMDIPPLPEAGGCVPSAGVVTPEDPYPTWQTATAPVVIAPLFVLYDHTFRPAGTFTKEEALSVAASVGVVCTEEYFPSCVRILTPVRTGVVRGSHTHETGWPASTGCPQCLSITGHYTAKPRRSCVTPSSVCGAALTKAHGGTSSTTRRSWCTGTCPFLVPSSSLASASRKRRWDTVGVESSAGTQRLVA